MLDEEDDDPEDTQHATVTDILLQVRRLMGYNTLTFPQRIILRKLVIDTLRQGSIAWGIRQAKTWGGIWDVAMTQLIADAAFIALHGSLTAAARARWDELSAGRMTEEKVHATIDKNNPYFQRVLELARRGGGVPIHVPDDFVPNSLTESGPPKLSQQTQEAGAALRRMVCEGFHQKRLCFLMTTSEAMKWDPHINPSHWVPKAGTPQGRNCLNGSNGGKGNQALNSDELREWARDRWGHIKHPTIEEYVRMIVEFVDAAIACGKGKRTIRLWKMDIAGAYTQLTYRAEDVHLMACSIPGDLVAFFMCGTFRWGAMPFAFHPITDVASA